MTRIEQHPRAHLSEPAHGAADLTVLIWAEVAALTPETERAQLARFKQAAAEEGDSGSGEEGTTRFAVKANAQEISKALATYRELYVVQKSHLRRLLVLAKTMSSEACLDELEAIIATTEQQVQSLKGQITVLEAMLMACAAANDTYNPAAFFNALAKSWEIINNDPGQLIVVLGTPLASSQYANLTKEQKG